MKARIDALALNVINLMPYGYAVLLGMLLREFFGGAK